MIKTLKKNKNNLYRKTSKISVRTKSTRNTKTITKINRTRNSNRTRNRKQRGGVDSENETEEFTDPLDDFFTQYTSVENLNIDDIINNAMISQIRDVQRVQHVFKTPTYIISNDFLKKLIETIHNNRKLKKIGWSYTLKNPNDDNINIFNILFSYSSEGGNISFQYLKELDEIKCSQVSTEVFNTDLLIDFFNLQEMRKKSGRFTKIKKLILNNNSFYTIAGLYNLCVLELLKNIDEVILNNYNYKTKYSSYKSIILRLNKMKDKIKEVLQKKYQASMASLFRLQKEFSVAIFGNLGIKPDFTGLTLRRENAITNEELLSCCNNKLISKNFMFIKFLLKFFKKELTKYDLDNEKPDDELYLDWKIFNILLMGKEAKPLHDINFSDAINEFFWYIFVTTKYKKKLTVTQNDFLNRFKIGNSFDQFKKYIDTQKISCISVLQTIFPQLTMDVIENNVIMVKGSISDYLRDVKIPIKYNATNFNNSNNNNNNDNNGYIKIIPDNNGYNANNNDSNNYNNNNNNNNNNGNGNNNYDYTYNRNNHNDYTYNRNNHY